MAADLEKLRQQNSSDEATKLELESKLKILADQSRTIKTEKDELAKELKALEESTTTTTTGMK